MSEIEIRSDGTLYDHTTGLEWRPMRHLEMRTYGRGEHAALVMDLEDLTLTPALITNLIDGYEFAQKALGGTRIMFR